MIKTPERGQWSRSGIFIANFEQISYIVLVSSLLSFNKWMAAGVRVISKMLKKGELQFHISWCLIAELVSYMGSLRVGKRLLHCTSH